MTVCLMFYRCCHVNPIRRRYLTSGGGAADWLAVTGLPQKCHEDGRGFVSYRAAHQSRARSRPDEPR